MRSTRSFLRVCLALLVAGGLSSRAAAQTSADLSCSEYIEREEQQRGR